MRITITETANVNESIARDAQTGHAAQSTGDITITRSGDVLSREHRDDLRRRLLNIAITTTDDHDLARDVDVDDFFDHLIRGRLLFRLLGGRRRLLSGGEWHGECCDEQQHSLTVEQVIHDRPRVRQQS